MMTIDDERPEDELHIARAGELLGVMALILQKTGGRDDTGVLACPTCSSGVIGYWVRDKVFNNFTQARLDARCTTPGCIAIVNANLGPR